MRNQNKVAICDFLFELMLVIQSLLFLLLPFFGKTRVESLLLYGLWACVLLIVFFGVSVRSRTADRVSFFLLSWVFVSVYLSIILGEGSPDFNLVISILNFISCLVPYFCVRYVVCNERVLVTLKRIAVIQAFIMIALSFSSKGYAPFYAGNGIVNDGSLTLGYGNPNMTAIHLYYVVTMNCYFFNKESDRRKKILYAGLICFLSYLVIETKCRSITLLLPVMLFTGVYGKKRGLRKVFTSKALMLACIAMPLIFLVVFNYMHNNYPSLEIMGEAIFSRNELYQEAYKDIRHAPYFGNATSHQFVNSHNAYIAILLNIGIFGLVAFLSYVIHFVERIRRNAAVGESLTIIPYMYILSLFIHSCVEAGAVIGGVIFGANLLVICYLCEDGSISRLE